MSTDGTQPPSIAPRKPAGTVRTAEGTQPRPASGPVSGPTAPSTAPAAANGSATVSPGTTPDGGPSVGERLKKAAQATAGAARSALPTKDETDKPGTVRTSTRPAEPARGAAPAAAATPASSGPRKVRLAVARVDPWSVMKLSFLLAVAVGIMIVVAAAVVWYTLDGLHVFTDVNDVIATLAGSPDFFPLEEYVSFKRVISLATMVAVVDVVLLTALATIGAFLYNIVAALVGGIHLTLTDD